jgi:N-acetylglucosaminyl-diphospho-decaprenol L-rhamnosyltransferase
MRTSMAASLPSLSVVIPTRDTRDLTLRCLSALGASHLQPAEILVVDDGSRDGSADAVRAEFPGARVLRRERPGGFTVAINDAWPRATCDVVLLLNSDTEVDANATAHLCEAFARDPQLGIAGASLVFPDGRPQWSAGAAPTAAWLFALGSGAAAALARVPGWRRLRPESQADGDAAWVPATAMGVRAEVMRAIGLFDPHYGAYVQDLDYCVRAGAAGWRVAQLRDVRVVHLRGATMGATVGTVKAGWSPDALVGDLARWIRRAHAPADARRLARALDAGLRARLAVRTMCGPFRSSTDRARWACETAAYEHARARLREAMASR